jgi:hypothetical protein
MPMKPLLRPAPSAFRARHLAAVKAPLALALALLPATAVAAVPRAFPTSGALLAASPAGWKAAESQSPPVELAGRKSGDESFDPYGKDDPTSKKWGTAAGLLGNRYGGMRTGGGDANNAGRRDGRNADREDRDSRSRGGQEGGRN